MYTFFVLDSLLPRDGLVKVHVAVRPLAVSILKQFDEPLFPIVNIFNNCDPGIYSPVGCPRVP